MTKSTIAALIAATLFSTSASATKIIETIRDPDTVDAFRNVILQSGLDCPRMDFRLMSTDQVSEYGKAFMAECTVGNRMITYRINIRSDGHGFAQVWR